MVVTKNIRSVEGMTLDYVSQNLYFTDNSYGFIAVVRINGNDFSDRRDLITDLGNPRDIVTHPAIG